MMKKLSLFLAVIMALTLCFAACDSQQQPDTGSNKPENPALSSLARPFVTVNEDGMACWSAIENAVKYIYKIDDGEEKVTYATAIQLEAGNSIVVKAVGDGQNYGESEYSVACIYGKAYPVDGWYLLSLKTVEGINVTSQYICNAIHLLNGSVTWYQLDWSGANTRTGTYTVSGETLRIKMGIKVQDFTIDNKDASISFKGSVDLQQVSYKFEKQENFSMPQETVGGVDFTSELFGDDIQRNYYNYCPTVMVEDNTMHIWYCSNKDDGEVVDHVAYRKGTLHEDGKWTFSEKYIVMAGTANTWDSKHVCDPSVVKGEFKFNGETYNYMLAYLGCVTTNNTKNEIGVAFAKRPEGPFVKADNLNPVGDYYGDFGLSRTSANSGAANNAWGYGQPSLINVDKKGKVLLFYSCGTTKGTYTTVEYWDMSDVNNAQLISKTDLSEKGVTNAGGSKDSINNADFVYDSATKRLYCIKEDFPYGDGTDGIGWITESNTICYLQLDSNESFPCETVFNTDANLMWSKVGSVTPALTGYTRNHNCGFVSDPYGWMVCSTQLYVVYTMSLPYTDFPDWKNWAHPTWGVGQWPALHTYRLHGITFDIVL